MKKIYICPMAKMVNLTNAVIMAGSIQASAEGETDEVGAKETIWQWMEE